MGNFLQQGREVSGGSLLFSCVFGEPAYVQGSQRRRHATECDSRNNRGSYGRKHAWLQTRQPAPNGSCCSPLRLLSGVRISLRQQGKSLAHSSVFSWFMGGKLD